MALLKKCDCYKRVGLGFFSEHLYSKQVSDTEQSINSGFKQKHEINFKMCIEIVLTSKTDIYVMSGLFCLKQN